MSMFQWKAEYALGHVEIDGQHKRLFELANELHSAMSLGKGKDALSKTIENLVSYTKQHFANEERLMKLHHYPDYLLHKADHDALTKQVVDFHTEFDAGRAGLTIDLLTFLQDWLTHHIGETDRKVATFLKSKAA